MVTCSRGSYGTPHSDHRKAPREQAGRSGRARRGDRDLQVTTRRDLEQLTARGRLRRIRGDAVSLLARGGRPPFALRELEPVKAKQRTAAPPTETELRALRFDTAVRTAAIRTSGRAVPAGDSGTFARTAMAVVTPVERVEVRGADPGMTDQAHDAVAAPGTGVPRV